MRIGKHGDYQTSNENAPIAPRRARCPIHDNDTKRYGKGDGLGKRRQDRGRAEKREIRPVAEGKLLLNHGFFRPQKGL